MQFGKRKQISNAIVTLVESSAANRLICVMCLVETHRSTYSGLHPPQVHMPTRNIADG